MPYQMVINSFPEDNITFYQVLDLPWNVGAGSDLSEQDLKSAYRRALLQHHPDKIKTKSDSTHDLEARKKSGKETTYTIDQITEAYATLSVPKLRSEYDRILMLRARPLMSTGRGDDKFRSGLEVVDLDDLSHDERGEVWFKSCRCGEGRGFQFSEADLEEASEIGELHVGCRGCSLWLKVLFGFVEDEAEDHMAARA